MKNATVKNASWIIIGKSLQMCINLIVGLLTARYLGPSNYGIINYAAAYVSFFSAFCTLGINSIIVKEFVDYPNEEGKIIGTTLGLRAVSSFLSAIIIVLIVLVVDGDEKTTLIVVGLYSIGMIFQVFETINFWFQSKLQSKVTAIISLLAYLITAFYKVILLFTGKSVVYFAFATSVDYICIGAMLLYVYKKYNGAKLYFSWEYGKNILKKSCHFIAPGLMVAIYGQTDKIMLKQMLGTTELGYYSTAVAICSMWCFVLGAIIDSLYPSIMQANNKDEKLFLKRNKQLYAIVFYISIAVSVMFTLLGGKIIQIMYGEAYMPAIRPLRIITWYTAFSYLGVARNAWVVCKNKQKYLIYIYVCAAISNIVLNLILIPMWGVEGAAVASVVAQIITTIVAPFFIKSLKENSIMMVEAICLKGIYEK